MPNTYIYSVSEPVPAAVDEVVKGSGYIKSDVDDKPSWVKGDGSEVNLPGNPVTKTFSALTSTRRPGHVNLLNPAAASTSGGGDQLDLSAAVGGEQVANLVQPDVPRSLVINLTDANVSISAFQIDVVAKGWAGQTLNLQYTEAGGLDQESDEAVAFVTSITVTSITGNGAGDTLDIGYGDKLGVPVPPGATGLEVNVLKVSDTQEAPAAVDATNNTVTPTTVPDAAEDYEIFFSYIDPAAVALNAIIADLLAAEMFE